MGVSTENNISPEMNIIDKFLSAVERLTNIICKMYNTLPMTKGNGNSFKKHLISYLTVYLDLGII